MGKRCTFCERVRPDGQFRRSKAGRDGLSARCRECVTAISGMRNQEARDRITRLKAERGCADCGFNKDGRLLEFDHLPGTEKIFNISSGVEFSKTLLDSEIAKCEVVCQSCHHKRTSSRGPAGYTDFLIGFK